MKKASIHFEPVHRIEFEASHLARTELHEPKHLLPIEHRLPNFEIEGSMSLDLVEQHFHQAKAKMTGQAKARGSAAMWDGVIVLPDHDDPEDFERVAQSRLVGWREAYEKLTGQRVLHMAVHRDEGYVDEKGKPHYNFHAHALIDRLDAQGRVIKLERRHLSAVQDMTAERMGMPRGSTLAERLGKRGRAHVPHREYREKADADRVAALKVERADLLAEIANRGLSTSKQRAETAIANNRKLRELLEQAVAEKETAQEALKKARGGFLVTEVYREIRGAFKHSQRASQAHYSALKRLHDTNDTASLNLLHKKIGDEQAMFFALADVTGLDLDELQQRIKAEEKSPPRPDDDYQPGM